MNKGTAQSKRTATALRPANQQQQQQTEALFQQGFQHFQQGRPEAAKTAFDQVLKQQPRHCNALYLLGAIAAQSKNPALAAELIGRALDIVPGFAEGHYNQSVALMELERFEDALHSCDRAIAIQPDYADAHYNRCLALEKLQRREDAVAGYQRLLALHPRHADACFKLGHLHRELQQWEQALGRYEQVIAIQPDHTEAQVQCGKALLKLQRPQDALASLERALALNPQHLEAHWQRGNAFMDLNQWDSALGCYDQVLAQQADSPYLHAKRAEALWHLGRMDEALQSCEQAIALKPDYVEAWCVQGAVLLERNQWQAALPSFDRAIAMNPDFADAWFNKSLALLVGGQFQQAWPLYEWRWKAEGGQRTFAQPVWTGTENLSGKTILLHCEQGFGDSIQFCRYARLVKQLGAKVLLGVPPKLAGLLAQLEGVDEVLQHGNVLPAFDYHCPFLSLPLAFKTELHSIPNLGPYLTCTAAKRSAWALRLGASSRLRVGLVWRGNAAHKNDRNRSVPLAEWLAHLPPGLDYVSLQKDLPDADLQLLRTHGITHYGEDLHDFSDTAALCDGMDLVISVDTSVAHLAAAMGKPTWILLPYTPDWRWLLERSDSPWYSSARLYRQAQPAQWQHVLERVAAELRSLGVQQGKPALPTTPAIPQAIPQGIPRPAPQVEAVFQQGLQLHRQGQLAQAKAAYEEVLQQQPRHFDALQLLGAIAGQSDQPALAVELIGRAIAIHPGFAKAHTNLAIALLDLNRPHEALSSCDRALALMPDFADAHTNRGLALLKLGRVEEALACHEQAIACKPDDADAHSNRGAALYECKRLADALASYDRALAIAPQHAKAHTNKAFALLAGGQFRQGWEQYAWRLKVEKHPRTFIQPLWTGTENLHGKTILLHAEQGLGDCIQFCRYARLVQQTGTRVLLEVPAPLSALLRGLAGVDLLLQAGEPLPAFDFHCPLLSLPLAFKTELHSIPSPGPYVYSRADKRSQWSQRLGEKKNLRVGLVWRGNPAHTNDRSRSLSLAELVPYLPSGVDYVSLQKEVTATELQLLHDSSIQHGGEQLQDFADTAALCDLLDIVLSVDTAVAHLAAAMGKPCWIVLPYAAEWRWLQAGDTSAWYASARLYRQAERGQWGRVLERVAHDLQQAQHSHSTFQRACGLHQQGQLALAKSAYEQVLQSQPTHVETLHLLGVLALQSNQHAQALAWMERAVAINPAYVQAHFHLGMVFLAQGQLEQALGSLEQTLALQADNAPAHCYRGVVLHRLNRVEEAIAAYDQAIAHKPDYAKAFTNRGLALHRLRRLDEALSSYDQAIAIAPDFAEAHSRRGVTLVKCNRLEPALLSFDRALALDPSYHETWFNKAMALLLGGEFGQGWELYEWRWKGERAGYAPGPFEQALWLGAENLSGKTILLLAEQGLGDCIQFCRYARLVKQRGARVLLQAPTPLLDLL
ncbi:MAG: tetratricopeptide repeat protein, partial [Rhodoferax sp.]|nr:tetratricopeptide repeat protein [Rhodoferax sp.]